MENYYQTLGIEKTATHEEIKERYLFLVKAYHPDRYTNPNDRKIAEEEIKKINNAYNVIGNENNRKEYDQTFNRGTNEKEPQTSTNNTSSEDDNEEAKQIYSYFEELLVKWKLVLNGINIYKLKSSKITDLYHITYTIFENAKFTPVPIKNEVSRQINQLLERMAYINIALGLEFESSNRSLKCSKETALLYSTFLPIAFITDFVIKLSRSEEEYKEFVDTLSAFAITSQAYAEEMFAHGTNKYREMTSHAKQNTGSEGEYHTDKYPKNYCTGCGEYGVTANATYRKNIGLVFLRRYSKVAGDFCPVCQEKLFWKAFITNIFLGWWGVISFFINPFLIIQNVWNYIHSWKIRSLNRQPKMHSVDWKLAIPLLVVVSIGVVGYFRSIPSQAPLSSFGILYSDDFFDNNSGWEEKRTENSSANYLEGKYFINVNGSDLSVWRKAPTEELSDNLFSVTVFNKFNGEYSYSSPDIIWHYKDNENLYVLSIDKFGYIYVSKFVDNIERNLYKSNGIVQETMGSYYSIMVSFKNGTSKIFINYKLLTTINDTSFSSGSIGLGVNSINSNSGTAIFDNFIVYTNEKAEQILPKSPTVIEVIE